MSNKQRNRESDPVPKPWPSPPILITELPEGGACWGQGRENLTLTGICLKQKGKVFILTRACPQTLTFSPFLSYWNPVKRRPDTATVVMCAHVNLPGTCLPIVSNAKKFAALTAAVRGDSRRTLSLERAQRHLGSSSSGAAHSSLQGLFCTTWFQHPRKRTLYLKWK